MHHIKIFAFALIGLASFLFPIPGAARDNEGSGNNNPTSSRGQTITLPYKKHSNRPGAPSRTFITGWYTNSYIELTFPAEVEYMTVSLSAGDVVVWEDVLTVDEPSAHFPEMHGEFTLTVTTDDGRVFECVLDL